MRKNTARHWLHAGLDLLPLILIPVFMIYSHRHTIDSGSIEVPVNKVVDFNQLANVDFDILNFDNGFTFESSDDGLIIIVSDSPSSYAQVSIGRFTPKINDIYLVKSVDNLIQVYLEGQGSSNSSEFLVTITNVNYSNIFLFASENLPSGTYNVTPQVFNLTQMFGSGNEPTIEQFNQWYSNDYYDYTLSSKQLLKGYSTQTYNDTDIMSQFTYQLYNSVDKYFNMGNVFGMSNVYDWFNLNIFGGNAPISIYIVWNIVLYEFVMDLLFLLYALFMWFIDVTKRLIEKPLDSIK